MSFRSKKYKFSLLFLFLLIWEIIARIGIFPKLIFPSISETFLFTFKHPHQLLSATYYSLSLLGIGLGIGILIAFLISGLSMVSQNFMGIIETLLSFLYPLPSISLIAFAILWFGLGQKPIIALVTFSATFPITHSILNGFGTVNPIYHDVGRNYGLSGYKLIWKITMPASLPYIITGFRQSWAASWKTIIAGELVFGSTSAVFGLGWYIYVNRFLLNSAGMVACLMVIGFIGFVVENVILDLIEAKTVRKWGMKR